jgi:putative chitinase
MIDWSKTQRNIGAGVDGVPGRETFGRLMGKAVGHSYDDTMRRLGESAVKHFPLYGVDTSAARLEGIIAETGHETGGFRQWEENLNYSAQGLANTWPNRFALNPKAKVKVPNDLAKRCDRRPQDIACQTYGARMGNLARENDNDANEDGWQYRGRGPTMLTGKDNYIIAAGLVGINLLSMPELAADPFTGLLIACAFYKKNGIFRLMDIGDNEAERRAVNGGLIGYKEVQEIRGEVRKLLVAA